MSDPERANLNGTRVYLSIGSNTGEREKNVLQAVRGVCATGVVRLERLSSLYETGPVGCAPMRDFINAVAEVKSVLCPRDLLARLQSLESAMGRCGGHNAPRIIDIDILTFGEDLCNAGPVILPHPRYHDRAFVLVPLLEIAPDFVCPSTGRSVDAMIGQLSPGQWITRVSGRDVSFVVSGVHA